MEGGVDETGPNDAFGFVWALGEFFFIYLHIFLILTNPLLHI